MHSIIQVDYSRINYIIKTMNKSHTNWKEVKLGDIIDITMGQSPKSQFYNKDKEGMPFLQGSSTFGHLYPSFEIYSSDIKKIAVNGSVLMSVRAPVGDLNMANTDICIGRGLCSINGKNKSLNRYIFYLLNYYKAKIINIQTGTVFGAISKDNILNFKVSIPRSEEEQKRIASILSSLDDKIELNNKTNRILEELAQTIFEEWFINFNFPNEDGKPYKKSGGEMIGSELGKIPKGWKVGTIGDYAKLKSGFAFKNSWWQNDGIPVIKIQNISSGNLNLEQCSFVSEDKYNIAENFRVNGGDLLISLTGSLGKFAIVPKLDKDALVNQRVGKFFLGKEPVKKLPFLYGILNELKDLIVSLANGSVQQNISPTDIENVKIIFPSDKILNKYNNLMQDVFYKIIFNQRENEKLSGIRDSLLPKLMDGEIRVRE